MSQIPPIIACTALLCAASASASEGQPLQSNQPTPAAAQVAPQTSHSPTLVQFGDHELQTLDFYSVGSSDPAPLILFVHGGGWTGGDKLSSSTQTKISHFHGLGFHFASTNYRLVPDATLEEQVTDVALSLASLLKEADRLKIDRDRVVLLGHSAGAHLVSLLGTDPEYLAGAGLSHGDIAGMVSLDISIYDAARRMSEFAPGEAGNMGLAFGSEAERHRALSPALHVTTPNVRNFLILHVDRPLVGEESQSFAELLREAGDHARVLEIKSESSNGHREINERMGDPTYAGTTAVDNWLEKLFD